MNLIFHSVEASIRCGVFSSTDLFSYSLASSPSSQVPLHLQHSSASCLSFNIPIFSFFKGFRKKRRQSLNFSQPSRQSSPRAGSLPARTRAKRMKGRGRQKLPVWSRQWSLAARQQRRLTPSRRDRSPRSKSDNKFKVCRIWLYILDNYSGKKLLYCSLSISITDLYRHITP